jgi:sialate O-acetylesterase
VKDASSSKIRFFQVGEADAKERAYHLTGVWKTCDPNSVGGLSGVAWFFGRSLENTLGVTIGIVQVTANGTPAEPWTDRKAMAADPELKPAIMRFARKEKSLPGARFNGMIGPLAPLAIRGVAWYQGESNCAEAYTYRRLLPTLIDSWRALWGQGDFWFLLVQLPAYGPKFKQPGESEWAELREAQALTTKRSKVAMCVTLDTGDVKELHPTDKRDVGERLALVARSQVYGQSVECSGPTLKNFSQNGREFVVNFDHATGLHVRGGGKVLGFAVAGADRKWSWGEARIDGTKIVVKALNIEAPVALRYAWADNPDVNLVNAAGLPMAPFRTDDWPMITIPRDQPDKPDKPDGKKKR